MKFQPYYTVEIPPVPWRFATKFHDKDTETGGITVTRGAFGTIGDAIIWAQEHLDGCPYSILRIE